MSDLSLSGSDSEEEPVVSLRSQSPQTDHSDTEQSASNSGRARGRGRWPIGRGGRGRGRGGMGSTARARARNPQQQSTPDDVLKQILQDVPGWSPENQGEGIRPIPPTWTVDPSSEGGDWVQYTIGDEGEDGLFVRGKAPRWVRFEQVHIMLDYISKDAEFIGDWVTLDDSARHQQQVACAKLLGMLTMGTSKGIVTGSPAFLERIEHGPERESAMEQLRKNGIPGEYTFCPDPNQMHEEGLQFTWFFEWSYAEDGETRIGFWITKAIADPTHSSDEQWQSIMNENCQMWRHGQTSGTEERKRNAKMQNANKLHRIQVDATNLERNVSNMYKTITNIEDLSLIYHVYGGKSAHDNGWPSTPNRCTTFQRAPGGRAAQAQAVGRRKRPRTERGAEPQAHRASVSRSIPSALYGQWRPALCQRAHVWAVSRWEARVLPRPAAALVGLLQ